MALVAVDVAAELTVGIAELELATAKVLNLCFLNLLATANLLFIMIQPVAPLLQIS